MPELPDIAAYLHALETHTRDANANLTQITSPNGRSISLTYDALNRITSATDNAGRTVSYSYDSGGRLQTVTDVNGGITTFAYDANDLMTSMDHGTCLWSRPVVGGWHPVRCHTGGRR